jgi:glycosidase
VEHDGSNGVCAPARERHAGSAAEPGVDEQENDPDSLLSFYRQVLALRNQYPVFVSGDAELVETADTRLAAFTLTDDKQTLLIAHNFPR